MVSQWIRLIECNYFEITILMITLDSRVVIDCDVHGISCFNSLYTLQHIDCVHLGPSPISKFDVFCILILTNIIHTGSLGHCISFNIIGTGSVSQIYFPFIDHNENYVVGNARHLLTFAKYNCYVTTISSKQRTDQIRTFPIQSL